MKRWQQVKLSLIRCSILGTLVAIQALPSLGYADVRLEENQTVQPRIEITLVPPKGGGPDRVDRIAGTVSGADIRACKVVIFALGGGTWYVQPYTASPFTSIGRDGKWANDTHLGSEYAALLVEPSYKPPPTTSTLPEVGGDVLAIVRVPAKVQSAQTSVPSAKTSNDIRTLLFSGYEWRAKSSNDRVGPGPNYFSDSKNNVEVDAHGRLHLRITNHDRRWHCAEVISTRSFGYGTYRFSVDTNFDHMDPRVILGLFTWSDALEYSHREIDVEVSKWGDKDNKNGQFVVQPYTSPMNIVRFQIPPGLNSSTHSFTWKPDSIFCQSLRGINAKPPGTTSIIAEHTFTKDIPHAGGENARINLWLMDGHPPIDGKEMEVIVTKFEFAPSPER